jgi:SAM-dependent methyltransferase
MYGWLCDPKLRGLEIGSAAWFRAQQAAIRSKPLVDRCYRLWHEAVLADADSARGAGAVVELGSGSSLLKQVRPSIIASDVVGGLVDIVFDGRRMPFRDASVRALLLLHVFHHIPDVEAFLAEASRVLTPGGVISMIECAHTPFSRLFFGRIHPEPYRPADPDWAFPEGTTMLDSNQALSWMVFVRDRDRFTSRFPEFAVTKIRTLPWLSYLLSGGGLLRSALPGWSARFWIFLDRALRPLDPLFAIHWNVTVRKVA